MTLTGITTWLRDNALSVGIFIVALGILFLANKGQNAEVMKRVGGTLVAIVLVGVALSGKAPEIGQWALGLVGLS